MILVAECYLFLNCILPQLPTTHFRVSYQEQAMHACVIAAWNDLSDRKGVVTCNSDKKYSFRATLFLCLYQTRQFVNKQLNFK